MKGESEKGDPTEKIPLKVTSKSLLSESKVFSDPPFRIPLWGTVSRVPSVVRHTMCT